MSAGPPSVLFVCLGNICRSPLAEGAFRHAAQAAGLDVHTDSAGTGARHIGEPPDPRACEVALSHGIDISGLRARQVERGDFARFTHVLAMDARNLADLRAMAPADGSAEVALVMDHVPGREGADIADPYYGGEEQFEATWDDAVAAAQALVAKLSPTATSDQPQAVTPSRRSPPSGR